MAPENMFKLALATIPHSQPLVIASCDDIFITPVPSYHCYLEPTYLFRWRTVPVKMDWIVLHQKQNKQKVFISETSLHF